jgi:hypothetical protein
MQATTAPSFKQRRKASADAAPKRASAAKTSMSTHVSTAVIT